MTQNTKDKLLREIDDELCRVEELLRKHAAVSPPPGSFGMACKAISEARKAMICNCLKLLIDCHRRLKELE